MSDYPMLISNKLHSFRNFSIQNYEKITYNDTMQTNFLQEIKKRK